LRVTPGVKRRPATKLAVRPGAARRGKPLTKAVVGRGAVGSRKKTAVAVVKPATPVVPAAVAEPSLDAVVYGFLLVGDKVFAGTSQGLMQSVDAGRSWAPVGALGMTETRFMAGENGVLVVAGLKQAMMSADGGASWNELPLPEALTQLSSVTVDEMGNVWMGGREGVYYSSNRGGNWKSLRNLYLTEVSSVYFDSAGHRVLATSFKSTVAFAVQLPDFKVTFWDTGWNLRFVRPAGDHLVGATLYDGVVVQPVMVETKMAAAQ
jgi:hypothetical protein